MTCAAPSSNSRLCANAWLKVGAVAGGTFVMVTSEFLPIGLLGPMARDLAITEGLAGLMVTAPGLIAAIAAPLASGLAGGLDRRTLLVLLTGLIILADVVVASASSLMPVLLGRMLLGTALGAFWTFAASVGRTLVPEKDGNRATALILAGISVGTVAGVPIGTMIGDLAGWRAAFLTVASLGIIVLLAQLVLLPSIPGNGSASFQSIVSIARVPAARVGYVAAALIAGGHFAAYTYLQPFLASLGWATGTSLTALLAAYGIAGVVGTWAGERLASRSVAASYRMVALVLSGSIGLSVVAHHQPWLVVLALVLWGIAFGALPVCVQIWTYQAAPQQFEVGSALMVTVFQMAVAAGALLGGRLVDGVGLNAAFLAGTVLAALAALCLRASGTTQRSSLQPTGL